MILQAIRLKNIKSYGKGPEGNGVTVTFQPGVNRIAGRNGFGKSTLIESLGYALFLTEPQFEENFQLERYFLSYGEKEGEIDVTFSHGGESYRIERGVGRQSKRRSKVVQLSDDSICAENDTEVAQFLCRLLNFPDATRLNEMFSKLIGVKQGRLTWPFDSKPAEAKRFFDPLLDVDVFRECFNELKPAADVFKEQLRVHGEKRAALQTRVEERADSQEKVAACERAITQSKEALANATQARDAALKLMNDLEQLGESARNARAKAGESQVAFNNAVKFRGLAEQQVAEARTAVAKTQQHQAAFTAYTEATALLDQLETKRKTRDTLKNQREQSELGRVQSASKATNARDQIQDLSGQKSAKATARDGLRARATPIFEALEHTKPQFEKDKAAANQAGNEIRTMAGFVTGLETLVETQAQRAARIQVLAGELAAWNPAALERAATAEASARQAQDGNSERLAQAKQRLLTLNQQLKEISGGLCPFLKDKCHQFDPTKVGADVEACKAEIKSLEAQQKIVTESFRQAKAEHQHLNNQQQQLVAKRTELQTALQSYGASFRSLVPAKLKLAAGWLEEWVPGFCPIPSEPPIPELGGSAEAIASLQTELSRYARSAAAWWEAGEKQCQQRLTDFRTQELARQAQEQEIKTLAIQVAEFEKEIQKLDSRLATCQSEAARQEAACKIFAEDVTRLDEQLKPFASLDAELVREQQRQKVNQPGYESYLAAKELAGQLADRTARLEERKQEAANAARALAAAQEAEKHAQEAFDPEKLKAAHSDHQAKHDTATALTVTLESQKKTLKAEENRLEEWKLASEKLSALNRDIGRCEAALDLTETAHATLRDAAPEVARHLCLRIARRAQRVYNQINPDPLELEWDSDHYSLRAVPGDRRFAMLSGGEQTKLALAMTLAMIEEFSGLRFCIFDEPTYGVDADSLTKLADAILAVQQAAGLEQLLLVSHDDAFDGKIEHSIVLNKTSGTGTIPFPN